jgi:hypothetical protein
LPQELRRSVAGAVRRWSPGFFLRRKVTTMKKATMKKKVKARQGR